MFHSKDNSGVGLISENKNTSMPFAEKTSALLSLRYHYYDGNRAIAAFNGWLGMLFHELR
jgi:hypothetical protein